MMYQQQMQMHVYQQPMANGQPMPFGNQTPGSQNASFEKKNKGSPNSKNQRYEKKDKNTSA
jgi:hypothetical protein